MCFTGPAFSRLQTVLLSQLESLHDGRVTICVCTHSVQRGKGRGRGGATKK